MVIFSNDPYLSFPFWPIFYPDSIEKSLGNPAGAGTLNDSKTRDCGLEKLYTTRRKRSLAGGKLPAEREVGKDPWKDRVKRDPVILMDALARTLSRFFLPNDKSLYTQFIVFISFIRSFSRE